MNFDNWIKGPLTSLIGLAVMTAGGWFWFADELTNWEGGIVATIGFALLFMRDKIPGWIQQFVQAAISKFNK